ncbi:hypothetical protein Cgig2_030080 [Carnegiea gigantea]|uniref:Alpha/beta hydrolase fold-3 domain-containing protein n=1 Tax=Carnegiea gigantea TaxID=171969 RepID=A0A9Q1Q991_9CARY|nr:hypothetical protein Cgig2_030080 [Carnegiea gigantea]
MLTLDHKMHKFYMKMENSSGLEDAKQELGLVLETIGDRVLGDCVRSGIYGMYPEHPKTQVGEGHFVREDRFVSVRFWRLSLPPGESRDHPLANPFGPSSRNLEMATLDPILVIMGANEIMKNRIEDYAKSLRRLGKDVTYIEFEGQYHGFLTQNPCSDRVRRVYVPTCGPLVGPLSQGRPNWPANPKKEDNAAMAKAHQHSLHLGYYDSQ